MLYAAETGHTDIAKTLLSNSADLNSKEAENKYNALLAAVVAGHSDVVKLLLESGIDVNSKDKYGQSAIFLAAVKNHSDIVQILTDKGADVNVPKGNTALMAAAGGGRSYELLRITMNYLSSAPEPFTNATDLVILKHLKQHI